MIINGASSAGKSSLIAEFQEIVAQPYLDVGLDKFIFSLPKKYLREHWGDVLGEADRSGPMGHHLVEGMHRSLAALASSGLNAIADHVMVEPLRRDSLVAALQDSRVFIVGLHCPLAVLEAREIGRKDRTLGQAKKQHQLVHEGIVYDLEVDSSLKDAAGCAHEVADLILSAEPSALRAMRSNAN